MKKIIIVLALLIATTSHAAVLFPNQGGTGTSTIPTYGKVLVGNANGTYSLLATSSLGIVGTGGGGTWGSITGTLSDQTDLITALNAKFSLAAWYSTTTDQLTEGLTNLYYTAARVNSLINASTTIVSAASAPLSISSHLLSITQAGSGTNGYLSSTDWNTFNNKIASSSLSGSNPIVYNPSTGVISCPTCGTGTGNISGSGSIGELAMFTAAGSIGSVATGTVSSGAGISVTAGQKIIGTGLTITNTGVTSLAGTAGQISSTGSTGDITISIPQTSPISLPYASTTALTSTNLLVTSSTTLQNFTGGRSTTTNATTTTLYSPLVTATTICLTGDTCRTTWPTGAGGTISGSGAANRVTFWDGVSTVNSNANFLFDGTTVQVPALLNTGSTTLQSVTAVSATTTNLAVTGSSTIPFFNNYRFNGVYGSSTAITTRLLDSTDALDIKSGGDGLNINITASNGTTLNSGGGYINLQSGDATLGNAAGGAVQLYGGQGIGSGNGGNINVEAGAAAVGGTGTGGSFFLAAGQGGTAGGDGGSSAIAAGDALGGNGNGGDMTFYWGVKNGSGRDGRVQFAKNGTSLFSIFDFSNIATTNKTFTWPNMTGSVVVSSTTAASSLIPYASTTVLSAGTSYLGTAQATTLLLTGSSTLQLFTANQGTTTSFAVTSLGSGMVKSVNGSLVPATLADYAPAGSYITALTGDVSASGPGSVGATIGSNAVTFAKFQQVQANSLVGNPTGATANAQGIATSSLGLRQADIIGLKTTDTPSFAGVALTASSTLQNFTAVNATTSNATSTTLAASSSICLAGDCRSAWPFTGAYPFTPTNNYGVDTSGTSTPMSFFGGLNASSTSRFNLVTISQATTTNFASNTICLSGDCRSTWPTGGVGGGVSDWQKETTYNTLSLTPTTTIPVWLKDKLYASSSITVDGQVLGQDGTFSLPSFTFASDPDTGLYRASANTFGLTAGGSTVLTGSGTSVNYAVQLRALTGSASAPGLSFLTDSLSGLFSAASGQIGFATAQTERMRLIGNGSLGIGTSTPAWNLQIATSTGAMFALSDTSAAANFKHWVIGSQGGAFTIASSTDAFATSTVNAFIINNKGNVGVGTSSPVFGGTEYKLAVAGDTLINGGLVLKNSAGISPLDNNAVGTGLSVDGVASLTGQNQSANSTSLTFGTRKLTAGLAYLFQYRDSLGGTFDGVSIQNFTGKMGIGTSSPISNLTITGVQASTTLVDSSAGVNLKNWGLVSKTGGFLISTSTDMGVLSSNPAIAISSNGYFGIATSSPFRALSVAGDAIFQGGTAATSTLNVTSSSASKGGRIVLKDVNGTTCTEITTLAGVMTAKAVTCP